jgi:ABC-type transport system involved in cytochrome c biogenesis permease subunit
MRGLGAQWAWGSYWQWDPTESWHLAASLATAIGFVGLRRLSWGENAARWALYGATCLAIVVASGMGFLVVWLGLSSLYMMG